MTGLYKFPMNLIVFNLQGHCLPQYSKLTAGQLSYLVCYKSLAFQFVRECRVIKFKASDSREKRKSTRA